MQAKRKLAIMQPYFLPYLGYFQLMAKADVFVIYDDVNFINRGWINRNRININDNAHLFTIPLRHASQNRLIYEIEICNDNPWRSRLLRTIQQAYLRASQFQTTMPLIEQIVEYPARNLAEYILNSLTILCKHFSMATHIVTTSRSYENGQLRAQTRIIDICQRENAETYINSIGGTELYDRLEFASHGIELQFLIPNLQPYPVSAEFLPGLSIIDIMMHNDMQIIDGMLHGGTLS